MKDISFVIDGDNYEGFFCELNHKTTYHLNPVIGNDPLQSLTINFKTYKFEECGNTGKPCDVGYAKIKIIPSDLRHSKYIKEKFPQYKMYNEMSLYGDCIEYVAIDLKLSKIKQSDYKTALELSDLYYIEEMFIEEKFRGLGIGKLFMQEIENNLNFHFGHKPLLCCMAFPYEAYEEHDLSKEDLKKEVLSLCCFYEKCGFEKIPSDEDRGILSNAITCVKNPY